jgi:ubiquinone/menaquinone biosynthesis C-methylase UbiE
VHKHKGNGETDHHVCPVGAARIFDNPLRLLIHQPGKMLRNYVKPGAKVLDFGCGLGFFSIAMAKMVGEDGLVIAADLQDVMLQGLMKRARRAGVAGRIRPHLTAPDRIGVEDHVDFAIACWVIHETPDVDGAFRELASILKPGGRLFVLEPRSHASEAEFGKLLAAATAAGLHEIARPRSVGDRAVVLERPPASP